MYFLFLSEQNYQTFSFTLSFFLHKLFFGGLGVLFPWPHHAFFCSCECVLSHFSHVWLFVILWTVAHQAPLSMRFSRQEYWSGLPCPPPGDLPYLGTEPAFPEVPALQANSLLLSHWESPFLFLLSVKMFIEHLLSTRYNPMYLEYISEKRKTFPPEFINREQTIHIINASYYKKGAAQ